MTGRSMRRLLSLLLCAVFLACAPAASALAADVSGGGLVPQTQPAPPGAAPQIFLDGASLSLGRPAVAKDGCVLVPLYGFLEALDVTVEWSGEHQTFLCWRGTASVLLQLGIARMAKQVDRGEIVFTQLELAPFILSGQALAPLVPLAEAFGYETAWNEETRTMLVTTPTV